MTAGPGGTNTTQPIDDVQITRHDEYVELEFAGEFSPEAAMGVVDIMAAASAEAGCSSSLLDCRHMTGPLTVVDRFAVAEYSANVIQHLKVAMLVREDRVLPDRFFENAAVNHGVRVKLFTDADEAIGWLQKRS